MAKAYLIGAGPGDPKLLTLAALEALQDADVILCDRLVTDEVLALANPDAEKIYVGKHEGEQEAIQSTIFEYFGKFKDTDLIVVRLKGGDPYVFGRGSEEYLFLKNLGYKVIVIPGISAAVGLPTLAGIPLTARGVSSAFAVITGHGCNDDTVRWAQYSSVDTLVILMAVKERSSIAGSLIEVGRSPHEPIAFIENGGRENQRVIRATLADVRAGMVQVESPSVFIVGHVTSLYDELADSERIRNQAPQYNFARETKNLTTSLVPGNIK